MAESCFIINNLHSTATEHVRRAYEYRVADASGNSDTIFDISNSFAIRLRYAEMRHDFFECVAVFSIFDSLYVSTDDRHTEAVQRFSKVDSCLATERNYDTFRFFEVDDIHYIFHSERFEVEFIRSSIVGRNSFRVVVDDDSLVASAADRPNSVNSRVVEFDTLTDTDWARAENDDFLAVRDDAFVFSFVSRIEIRYVRAKFACASVNHLIYREYVVSFTHAVYVVFGATPYLSYIFIADTEQFCIAYSFRIVRVVADNLFEFNDVFEFFEEEHIDFCSIVNHTEVNAKADELSNGIETVVGSSADIFEKASSVPIIKFFVVDVAYTSFERAHSFEKRFFESAANAHNFACSLHLSAESVLGSSKFVEWETSYFSNYVVESRFERSRSICDLDFVEAEANGDFRTYASDRVTAGFRSKGRRTAYARVYFDEVVVERVRVESKLNVATAFDFQFANDFECRVAEELILFVCESL